MDNEHDISKAEAAIRIFRYSEYKLNFLLYLKGGYYEKADKKKTGGPFA